MSKKASVVCGVYQITNTTDGKIYVGKSNDVKNRWRNHRYQLKKGIHPNAHLQAAYRLDGADAFIYSILEECERSVIEAREAFHINALSAAIGGYNLLYPLPSNSGVSVHSEESRIKMSKSQRAKAPMSEEHKEKIRTNNAFTGKRRSPETIERMRLAQQNRKPLSDEGRANLSAAAKKRGIPEAQRAKMTAGVIAFYQSKQCDKS